MKPRNKYLAALLAMLLGFVGGHKIYLRDSGGIILFFFLFMVWNITSIPINFVFGFIDAFKLLKMPQQEFDLIYNRGFSPKEANLERRRSAQMQDYEKQDQQRPYSSTSFIPKSNPFKNSGLAKYKDFDLDAAIDDFNKALEISPNDVAVHFNLACAYSLTEKKDKSYYHIYKAVSLGFSDIDRILTHDDLAFIRIQPEFDGFKKSGFRILPSKISTTPAPQSANGSSTATTSQPQQEKQYSATFLAQLNKLDELRRKGILTEHDYALEKQKLER